MDRTVILSQGDLKIFCKQSEPDFGEIRRVVLGVHGLGGSTEDPMQQSVAEEMEIFGSATVRFDLPAHGQSPMGAPYFTLHRCKMSLLAAAKYAKEEFSMVEELCIFATGFGAYVTLVTLEELKKVWKRICLVVQSPSVWMHEVLLSALRVSLPTFRAMGEVTYYESGRPLKVRYSLYEDTLEHMAMTDHSVPMLIIHGEQDAYIPREVVQSLRRLNEKARLVIIPGATHGFLEENDRDMVLDLTRDWFEFQQVLMADCE